MVVSRINVTPLNSPVHKPGSSPDPSIFDPPAERQDGHRGLVSRQSPFLLAGSRLLVMVFSAGTCEPVIVYVGHDCGLFSGCSRLFCSLCILRIVRCSVLFNNNTERLKELMALSKYMI